MVMLMTMAIHLVLTRKLKNVTDLSKYSMCLKDKNDQNRRVLIKNN